MNSLQMSLTRNRILMLMGIAVALMLPASGAMAATSPHGESHYHIMLMAHLCNPSIKTSDDFQAMESGKSPIEAIARDVLACPTTALVGDMAATGTIASPRTDYDFSINSDTGTKTMKNDGVFETHKICESDVGLDLDGNGDMASTTCLDISHYGVMVPSGSSTILKVQETKAPAGYHLGALRFSPVALDGNNDSESLSYLNLERGRIDLNMVPDKDGMVMLHLYHFLDAATGTPTDGGTTTPNGGRSERTPRATR